MPKRVKDLFDQLDREEGNELDLKIKVDQDPIFQRLFQKYSDMVEAVPETPHSLDSTFPYVITDLTSNYITKLSLVVDQFAKSSTQKSLTGAYLSKLINESVDDEHKIFSNCKLSLLGFRNKDKKIQIIGNCGPGLGYEMISGVIEVEGNATSLVGLDMRGGELHIKGELKNIIRVESKANIYHKGKQVVKNGDVLDETYLIK